MSLADLIAAQTRGSRILTLDIETSPTLTYTFGMRPKWISPEKIVEPSRMLCFAAKWYDEPDTMFWSEWGDGGQDAMILAAWDLLDKADLLVTYNGLRFDEPRLRSEFVESGLTAPSPYKSVDLFAMAKRQFQFESMSLNHLAGRLDVGAKVQHTGFELWRGVLAHDPDSLALMETYNRGDVTLTEALYDRLRGWMPTHPHLGEISTEESRCNQCGGTDLVPDGTRRAVVLDYPLLVCRTCGAHVQRTRAIRRSALTRGV